MCTTCVQQHMFTCDNMLISFVVFRPQDPRSRGQEKRKVNYLSAWQASSDEPSQSGSKPGNLKTSSGKREKLQECTEEIPMEFMAEDMRSYARELGVRNLKKKVKSSQKKHGLRAPFKLSDEKVYFGGEDKQPEAYQTQDTYTPVKKKRPREQEEDQSQNTGKEQKGNE